MGQVFRIPLPDGAYAPCIEVSAEPEIADALSQLGVRAGRRALVIVGGAGKMADQDEARLRSLFQEGVAPLAAAYDIVVMDGGTDAGVMRLAGQARAHAEAGFDLIGIAAQGTVALPGRTGQATDRAPLEPHHSHFVFTPGTEWGDEAPWIARVATTLAGDQPSATILINGGEIAWQDAAESVAAGRPVFTVAGSGRTADILARAVQGDEANPRAQALVASGLINVLNLADDPAIIKTMLLEALTLPGPEDIDDTK
jgi:hypothetical protein